MIFRHNNENDQKIVSFQTILRSLGFEPRNDEIQLLAAKFEENGKQKGISFLFQ